MGIINELHDAQAIIEEIEWTVDTTYSDGGVLLQIESLKEKIQNCINELNG